MSFSYSPLRYPGGKTAIFDLIAKFIKVNKLQRRHYAEPYAGGCGLALGLLYNGYVSDIHINDIDRGIWAFWDSVLNQTDQFIDTMYNTPISVDEWRIQREKLKNPNTLTDLEYGFATFFLNRVNRSGIIKNAGVIGGIDQKGNYKIDCRFNKVNLEKRIRRVAKYKNRIHLTNLDAIQFLKASKASLPEEILFCIDPPYYNKGASLYTNFYRHDDHSELAECILNLGRPWVLTYDNTVEIHSLYKSRRQFKFNINYSAQVKRIGTELLIASKGLRIPLSFKECQSHKPQYRSIQPRVSGLAL